MAIVAAAAMLPAAAAADEEEVKKPSFAAVVETTSRQVTTCAAACDARDLLFGSSETLTVPVRQTGPPGDVQPTSPKLVLQGQQSGDVEVVGTDSISFEAAEGGATQDRFTIDLSGVTAPNEYTGAVLFGTTSGADQVSVPVTLKVREGPFWPLVTLLGTVALGAVLAFMLSQRDAAKFRREAIGLRARIDALPKAERSTLRPLWDKVWDGRNDDLPQAQTRLDALSLGAQALRECRDAQDEALHSPAATHLARWIQRIGNATARLVTAVQSFAATYDEQVALVTQTRSEFAAVVDAKSKVDSLSERAKAGSSTRTPYAEFKAAVTVFQQAIDGVPPDATQAAPSLEPLLNNVKSAFQALEKAHGKPLTVSRRGVVTPSGVGAAAVALATALGWPAGAGTDEISGRLTAFDVKAAIGGSLGAAASVGAMLVLLAVGFKITYLDNPTFGASLTDWLTLVFWGLAAYGARKTLTGLGSTPAST